VLAIVKNLVAYNIDPEVTTSTLREKMVNSLKNAPENHCSLLEGSVSYSA
jgi:hypothetical protein